MVILIYFFKIFSHFFRSLTVIVGDYFYGHVSDIKQSIFKNCIICHVSDENCVKIINNLL